MIILTKELAGGLVLIMQKAVRRPSKVLLFGFCTSTLLFNSMVLPAYMSPCHAESEASSEASSEAGSEAGLVGRRRRWWYRQQANQQMRQNRVERQREAQVRKQQQKAQNRLINRPDGSFVHNYHYPKTQTSGGTPVQSQPNQPSK